MKYLSLLFFLFFSILLSAQEQEEIAVYSSALQQGAQFTFGNKSIKFKEVVVDSRCPKDVTCIWAGEAKVLIEVSQNGKLLEERIIAVNSSNIPLNFSAEDILYTLNSIELLPYPTTKNNIPDKNYLLNMRVSEIAKKEN